MFSNNTKSTSVKAGQTAPFQGVRDAAVGRGAAANRGVRADTRGRLQVVRPPVPADRFGTALTFLLGLALMVGGSLVVAQIWANQAMIR